MINGYIENLDLPWEERLANVIKEIDKDKIVNFVLEKEREDKNTLVATLVEDGKPSFREIYITNDDGGIKKILFMHHDHYAPYLIEEYELKNEVLYLTRSGNEGIEKYVIMGTEVDSRGRLLKAEYNFLFSGKPYCEIYVKRDSEGNLIEETILNLKNNTRGTYKTDKYGRWLSYEENVGDEFVFMRKFIR